jgi:hypothetical protein
MFLRVCRAATALDKGAAVVQEASQIRKRATWTRAPGDRRPSTGDDVSNLNEETVVDVHHWTDRLFSFRTTRSPSFRFRSGEFTMIGIKVDGKPLLRA